MDKEATQGLPSVCRAPNNAERAHANSKPWHSSPHHTDATARSAPPADTPVFPKRARTGPASPRRCRRVILIHLTMPDRTQYAPQYYQDHMRRLLRRPSRRPSRRLLALLSLRTSCRLRSSISSPTWLQDTTTLPSSTLLPTCKRLWPCLLTSTFHHRVM